VQVTLPLNYYLRILHGIVAKGIGIEYLWQEATILTAMRVVTLVLAASKMRKGLA